MCGRYTLICIDDLGTRFRIYDPSLGFRSKFNVAPGQFMPVIVRRERPEAVIMQWGLDLQAKGSSLAVKPINIRAESFFEKPGFSILRTHTRCLIPASGFYEWKYEGRRKVPFYFSLKMNPVFAFAGLCSIWQDASGTSHETFAIITIPANARVAPVHNRMPVIIQAQDEIRWLEREDLTATELHEILAPYPAEEMRIHPVSSKVNGTDTDNECLIRPLSTLV
jgi:putative SOS response-associated peptidase YedK